MFQRILLCSAAVIFISFAASIASAASFSKLPIAMEVSSMTMSEDGQLVILSHVASNKLSIWDVASEKVIQTVVCDSPGAVLSRGDQTYVLSLDKGLLSVFSHSNWEMVKQVQAPSVDKANLTAPQGDAFKGVVIVSEMVDHYRSKLHVIDTQNDRFKAIGEAAASGLTSSYRGNTCIEQGTISSSPSATIEVKGSFDRYVSGRKTERMRGNHENTPLLYQVRDHEFWFGGDRIYRGLPPKPLGQPLGRIVVPDKNCDLAYGLSPQTLVCKSLTGSMAEIGSMKISFPESLARMKNKSKVNKKWGEVDRQHVAATIGNSLHIFIYSDAGDVYRVKTKAFAESDTGFAQAGASGVTPSEAMASPKSTFVVAQEKDASTDTSAETGTAQFAKMPISMQTTAMVITEDGTHLIMSHSASNKLSVWNIEEEAIKESIECDSPGKMISRGKSTYIGSGGGKISVLNNFTWQIGKKKADVGVNQINGLTAPQGRYFKGTVLVTSHFDRNKGQFTMVDVARDRAKVWHTTGGNSIATSSYNGRYVITQAGGGHIDTHTSFLDIATGRKTRSPGRNGERCPLIGQVRDNEFWFGSKWVFRGMPPKRTGDECLEIVVGDRNQDVFYRFDEQRVVAFSMKGGFQEIGSKRVEFPRDFERIHNDLRKSQHNSAAEGYDRDHVAITIGDKLHVFLMYGDAGDVYYCPMKAFVDTPAPVKAASTKSHASPKAPANPVRTWKDNSGTFSITAKLIDVKAGEVVLQRNNGEFVKVPLNRLSEGDRRYLSDLNK